MYKTANGLKFHNRPNAMLKSTKVKQLQKPIKLLNKEFSEWPVGVYDNEPWNKANNKLFLYILVFIWYILCSETFDETMPQSCP